VSLLMRVVLVFVTSSPVLLYLGLGVTTAIAIFPAVVKNLRHAPARAYVYAFVIDTLTWPDSVLTQLLRALAGC